MTFSRVELEKFLAGIYGTEKSSLIGPLVGTYEDEAAFKVCGVLADTDGTIVRRPAPIADELGFGYGAWILQLVADYFPKQRQIPITNLDTAAGWRTIPGWDVTSLQRVLELIERKGLVEIDRHMEPWLLLAKFSPDEIWKRIYDDLL